MLLLFIDQFIATGLVKLDKYTCILNCKIAYMEVYNVYVTVFDRKTLALYAIVTLTVE